MFMNGALIYFGSFPDIWQTNNRRLEKEFNQFFLFSSSGVDQPGSAAGNASVPLKFEDIVDKKIYDKMRPPKPGGES